MKDTLHHFRFLSLPLALLVSGLACGAGAVEAQAQVGMRPARGGPPLVTLEVERPGGGSFSHGWYEGAWYVAGIPGERYAIRVTNLTGERVEAVVSVDGRDVVTGALADYRRQRGYVLDPYGSVLIDGFRQSWQSVAAFRFGSIADSYSARRGTPQHVGVIGLAAFRERSSPPARPRPRPLAPVAPHQYAPHDEGAMNGAQDRAGAAAPPASESSGRTKSARAGGPARVQTLGTEYGETRYSAAREVTFRRQRSRRPEQLVTTYYDTPQALWARGIALGDIEPPWVGAQDPEPWPSARSFAPPPPRR